MSTGTPYKTILWNDCLVAHWNVKEAYPWKVIISEQIDHYDSLLIGDRVVLDGGPMPDVRCVVTLVCPSTMGGATVLEVLLAKET